MTPLERDVLQKMAESLTADGVGDAVTEGITAAYEGASLPSVEQVLQLLRVAPSAGEDSA